MYRALIHELAQDTDDALRDSLDCLSEFPLESVKPLDDLIQFAYGRVVVESSCHWRRLYTDACLVRSLAEFTHDDPDANVAQAAIGRLDHAIITAGAPGPRRHEMILELIQEIQSRCLPIEPKLEILTVSSPYPIQTIRTASNSVPRLLDLPSFILFKRYHARHPFILPGYASDWPALNERPWRSLHYLRSVAGRGRIVPVEVGSDYRTNDWTQQLMGWDEFLDSLNSNTSPVLYLAQHSLFLQFPTLRADIVIPDYVYSCPEHSKDFPAYKPPGNEEQLVINAWFGPKWTVSPAHTDPYHNFYAQIVGRKTVWLAPSHHTGPMYPFPVTDTSQTLLNPAANKNPSMSNTSQVDVFTPTDETGNEYPKFWEEVVPEAMSATLEPGDLLFFPPGWWHAFRSEDISFSVSMWF